MFNDISYDGFFTYNKLFGSYNISLLLFDSMIYRLSFSFLHFSSRLFPFIRLLFGLGIRHVGINTAKDIAGHYGSFQAFWAYLLTEVEREKKIEEEKEEETEEEENEGNTG